MENGTPIPVHYAKDIADQCEQDQVIVIGFHKPSGVTTVTTFGKSLQDCDQVAQAGNWLKEFLLKWPKGECESTPNRVVKLMDKLKHLTHENGRLRRMVSEGE